MNDCSMTTPGMAFHKNTCTFFWLKKRWYLKEEVWPWLSDWRLWTGGGFHCYTLWVLSYLDVWSSLHTCAAPYSLYPDFNKAKIFFISLSWWGLWIKHCYVQHDTQDTQSSWWQKHMLCLHHWLALWVSDSAWHPSHFNIFHRWAKSSSFYPS